MSQENSTILGEEWIARSLLEPEYPGLILPVSSIASVNSIDSEDLIFQEYSIDSEALIFQEYSIDSEALIFPEGSIAPEYSIDSEALIFPEGSIAPEYSIDSEALIFPEDSIANQERDIDPLTGRARGWGSWGGPFPNNGSQVTDLKDARLNIAIPSIWQLGSKRVTATVKVELDSSQRDFINSGGSLFLQSSVWGIDNTFYDRRNDLLFYFPDQKITQSGTYSFTTVVGTNQLNEDRWWFDNRDEIQASISLVNYSSGSPFIVRTHTNIFTGWF
jgi:hypothetical protein